MFVFWVNNIEQFSIFETWSTANDKYVYLWMDNRSFIKTGKFNVAIIGSFDRDIVGGQWPGRQWLTLGIRDTAFKIYLLTLNNNCTCVGWMIGHYERIDVYIELLSCSLGLTIDVWRWWRAGDGPSMSHSAKWDEGCQGWAMYRAGVTPCKEVSDLIFVININNPLSPHV